MKSGNRGRSLAVGRGMPVRLGVAGCSRDSTNEGSPLMTSEEKIP